MSAASAAEHPFVAPRSVTLAGTHIMLRPVGRRDLRDLSRVPDDAAWGVLLRKPAGPGVSAEGWLREAQRGIRRGTEKAWTIRDRVTGQFLGTTRFLNMDVKNARLEIGATWLLAEARGSVANAESKLLLLAHAFEDLGIRRVHIQADVRNVRSRAAIEKLGAHYEGTLRAHIVLEDGTSRDSAVYSIVHSEWPVVRDGLQNRVLGKEPAWRALPSSLLTVDPMEQLFAPAADIRAMDILSDAHADAMQELGNPLLPPEPQPGLLPGLLPQLFLPNAS